MRTYRTKSGKVEEKLQGVNATVSKSEKTQIAMAGGANTLKDVQRILGQEGKINNLKGQGAKHLVSFQWDDMGEGGYMGSGSPSGPSGTPSEGADGPDPSSFGPGYGETPGQSIGGPGGGPGGGPSGGKAPPDDPWDITRTRAVHKSDKPSGPSASSLDRTMKQQYAAGKVHAAAQQQYDIMNPKGKAIGGPGDRTGMGVYGLNELGELSFLGTEGYGMRDSLGDISQWSPSDYMSKAPTKIGGSPVEGMPSESWIDKTIGALTPSFKMPSKVNTTKMAISAIGGPLGTAFAMMMGRGVNEPPESPSTQPGHYQLMSQGYLGNKDLGIPDHPGFANMKAPPDYSPPKGGDSSESPTPEVVRAASNGVTLNIPEEEDFTRKQLRRAQRQVTRRA